MAFPMLVAISGFVTERWGRFDGNRVIPSLALPEQIVPSTVDVMVSERKNSKLPSSEVEPAAALEEFSAAIAALRNESGESHYKAAKMLQRVCENAAEHPDEDKVIRATRTLTRTRTRTRALTLTLNLTVTLTLTVPLSPGGAHREAGPRAGGGGGGGLRCAGRAARLLLQG